jgi:hypothetical protein
MAANKAGHDESRRGYFTVFVLSSRRFQPGGIPYMALIIESWLQLCKKAVVREHPTPPISVTVLENDFQWLRTELFPLSFFPFFSYSSHRRVNGRKTEFTCW